MKRDPTSTDKLYDGDDPSCLNIPGDNCLQKFLNFWLIVPKVQWNFFDLLYQMYTFDIFHQGFIPKFVHFFTIPTNVMLSMMFCAQFNFPGAGEIRYGNAFGVNVSLILLGVLLIAYIVMGFLRKSVPWGFATAIALFVLYMAGNLWYYSYRQEGHPWYNPTTTATNPIIWSYVLSLIQASSHTAVPQMPPNITGVQHWESFHMFFCQKRKNTAATCHNLGFVIASCLAFPILSVAVAWFSWPHLIGTEVIYIMAGIGYRPSFFTKFYTILEKVELQGNPVIDYLPTTFEDIPSTIPHGTIKELEAYNLLPKDASLKDIWTTVATIRLAGMYLRRGMSGIKPPNEKNKKTEYRHLLVMLNARRGYLTWPKQGNNRHPIRNNQIEAA